MSSFWARQPFKALYTFYAIAETIAVLPWLLLRYAPRGARPFKSWSLRVSVVTPLARRLLGYHGKTQSSGMSSVISDHKKNPDRYSSASPGDADLYSGVLKPGAAQPAEVGGLWYPAPLFPGSPSIEDEKVVLHFPGGAFVIAFGTDANGTIISDVMKKHLKATRTFVAQYRVSADDSTRFPAAVQDAVTFYHYILSLGARPQNIILSGDSAAGNLVIALLRYLQSSGKLPLPSGAMAWSPWVEVTSQAAADLAGYRNEPVDTLPGNLLQWGADSYMPGPDPSAEELEYISPLNRPFHTSVPLFIHGGSAEALYDVVKEFADQMKGIEHNRVHFNTTDLAPHDLLLAYAGLGLHREMDRAAEDAFRFFEEK